MDTLIKKANFGMIENIIEILKKHKAYFFGSYVYKKIIRENSKSLFSDIVKPHSKIVCNWPNIPAYTGDLLKYSEELIEHREKLNIILKQKDKEWEECDKDYDNLYYNPSIFPEYKDRMIEYDSIDCYMTYDNFENLKDVFEKSDYSLTIYMYQKKKYFTARIVLKSKIILDYEIKININYSEDISNMIDEIFKKSIFECDVLIISPYDNFMIMNEITGTSGPRGNFIKVGKIIDDITKKITKILDSWDSRITKNKIEYILNQGFNIYTDYFTTVDKNDEMCIICHEDCKKNKKNIKDIVCSAHYCIKCYDTMINREDFTQECPVCKSDVAPSDIELKIIKTILEIYDEYSKKRLFNEI
jgi:hypothetical protein